MIKIHDYKKVLRHLKVKSIINKHERVYKDQLKYLHISRKSDTLMIVFSGFTGEIRKYNYISSFMDLPLDQLYILDTWGVKGSYYWLENGENTPEKIVDSFIKYFLSQHEYKHVFTCGSSKGGTAAIYFGLQNSVEKVFAGACQYRVGTYLNTIEHEPILKGMIGELCKSEMINYLDNKLQDVIEDFNGETRVMLYYSTEEPTYINHIVPLKKCLDNGVSYSEEVAGFTIHSDVGIYFPEYVKRELLA